MPPATLVYLCSGGGVEEFLASLLTRVALALLELLVLQFLRWLWNTMRASPRVPQPA
jgi:hypothetical protein